MTHRNWTLSVILLPAIATLGGGCTAPSAHVHEQHVQADNEPAAPTNQVDIPALVRSNLGITFAQVERRHVASTMRVPGRFELLPSARREYRMTMPGHVELLVDQYEQVEAGQPLFRLRSTQWTALQSDIFIAEQSIALTESEVRVADAAVNETVRRLEILRSRIAALTVAETRRADLEYQAAELETSIDRLEAERSHVQARLGAAVQSRELALRRAAAALNVPLAALSEGGEQDVPLYRTIDVITVRAADRGIVEAIAVTNGAYVDEALLVVTVVQPDRVRFRAAVVQSEIGMMTPSMPVRLVPPQSSGRSPAEHVEASLSFGLEASPHQRTVEVIAAPAEHHAAEGRSWMRPGVSAFLEFVYDSSDGPALAIPRSALVKDGLKHVFFRRDPRDPNAAIRVEADLGPDDGRWVVVRSGVRLGDEVVLDGAYELKLATAQSGAIMRGGHFHPDGTWHADH